MKIAITQTRPIWGDIAHNFKEHKKLIHQAYEQGADLIVFPELALTGYGREGIEPFAFSGYEQELKKLQEISDNLNIVICEGLPVKDADRVSISMMIFQPNSDALTYHKRYLFDTEKDYFQPGIDQVVLHLQQRVIAPAICYESSLSEHLEECLALDATIYLSSVAKDQKGIEKTAAYYPKIANNHGIHVVLCNSVGPQDDFVAAGQSAVWDTTGKCVRQLNEHEVNLVVYNFN